MEKFLRPERFDVDPSTSCGGETWTHWKFTFEKFLKAVSENTKKPDEDGPPKMPVSYPPLKKGVEKVSLSLSRKRRDENSDPAPGTEERDNGRKDNNPTKRPFRDTYSNTLEVAKKLKLSAANTEPVAKVTLCIELEVSAAGARAMLNGHHQAESQQNGGGAARKLQPIATLTNLGNTCFLNSVLYTLRFAPRFLHNLHHLAWDLATVDQKLGSIRLKSSSLGRGGAGLVSSGARSWSSKDLLSLGQNDAGKSKIQIVTERLHETYVSLRAAEVRCLSSGPPDPTPEPYAADSFMSALRDVNSTFEGNRQQDAHELLVCILDNIRETCQALRTRAARLNHQENGDSNGIAKSAAIESDAKPTLVNLRKSWKKKKEAKGAERERRDSPTEERTPTPPASEEDARSTPGWDFVAEDFEGTTVLRTTCLECETVTERKQAMCDICVPVGEEGDTDDDGEPFRAAAVSSECLRDQNKYWCEQCLRYNEARRSVTYETLPRLLVLQLKRFSGGMEKITRHAPTPLELSCFCEACARSPRASRPHGYSLWAIIMHLGQALSGGHYIAFVRDGIGGGDLRCARETCGEPGADRGGFMRTLFNRPRPQPSGCNARECCAPRSAPDATWLACDDDLVKPVSPEEFDDILSPEPKVRSAGTPYLLFYAKTEVG